MPIMKRKTTVQADLVEDTNKNYGGWGDSDDENQAVVVKKVEEKTDHLLEPRLKLMLNKENQKQNLSRIKLMDQQYKRNLIYSL